jgi:hypothetical protein
VINVILWVCAISAKQVFKSEMVYVLQLAVQIIIYLRILKVVYFVIKGKLIKIFLQFFINYIFLFYKKVFSMHRKSIKLVYSMYN